MPDTDVRPAGGPDIAFLDFDADGVLRLEWARGVVIDGPNAQLATSNDEAVRWLTAQGHAGG